MPQRRVATQVLEARGAFLKHPERRRARANEPDPSGELGLPPNHLSAQQQEMWNELADIIPPGVVEPKDAYQHKAGMDRRFSALVLGNTRLGEVLSLSPKM